MARLGLEVAASSQMTLLGDSAFPHNPDFSHFVPPLKKTPTFLVLTETASSSRAERAKRTVKLEVPMAPN